MAARAKELFALVKLTEREYRKFPAQLSGGEAQRGAVVRALINKPSLVFADEPTGSLNSASSDAVLNLLTSSNRRGQSIVIVTHDMTTALRGNRVLYLSDGTIKGECHLGSYHEENVPDSRQSEAKRSGTDVLRDSIRRDQLQKFLTDMGW